jgi:hypothetical protein
MVAATLRAERRRRLGDRQDALGGAAPSRTSRLGAGTGPRSKPTCRSVISELARPSPGGGNRCAVAHEPSAAMDRCVDLAAPWLRSSRGSMHRGRIDRCSRMPSP